MSIDSTGSDNPNGFPSVEGLVPYDRESAMARARRRIVDAFREYPEDEAAEIEAPPADIVPISVAAGYREHRLNDRLPISGAGSVVDMAQYRRVQDARAAVEEAIETMPKPEPSQIEDLFLG